MNLTPTQLDLISKELIQGGIKYQDLYEELLDHYILAIEDRQAQGQTFESAFGEVHADFVNYKRPARAWDHYGVWKDYTNGGVPEFGIGKLQAEYEENLRGEISKRHWQIMKSYFRWPTLVTTLLVGLLTFQFAYLVSRQYFVWVFMACVLTPLLMLIPQTIKQIWRYASGKQKFVNSLKFNAVSSRLGLLFAWVSVTLNLPRAFLDYNIFREGPIVLVALLFCFYIAYSLSFYQLYSERFKVNVA
ncbi:hypothetical protein P1X15_14230 [Runella sp. MFBS21]|uniref:hypothetical protein n=1 Tax=Runella sp. MFBS21 TaxID=3034018 RepID=UPI0023F82C6E|nr:hypothetical protein [Runella sp. MFBS21]MDF7818769.1 hypothetical protein [Runella sp. MFBS21]